MTVSSEVDVTSAIKSAIEDDTSLTRSQIQTVEQEGSKSPALTISVVQEGSQTETPETKVSMDILTIHITYFPSILHFNNKNTETCSFNINS